MTNQSALLALRSDAPAAFGSRGEIQTIADRIRVMLPSAHLSDWQIKQSNRGELQKNLDESVYRAAQLCVFYRLVPGEDVHVIPFGNNWAVDMGIETWKKSADRYCAQHGITYHIVTEEMSESELRERRGENYHPDDYGMVAYLWRSDKSGVYEIFGAKQSMSRAAGIWAVRAKLVKGEWKPDQIPTQRSKQDVAKRRAMKAVLKLEFSLDSLLAATPAESRENVRAIESRLRSVEQMRSIPHTRQPQWDEDGCFVVDPNPPQPAINGVQFVVAAENDAPDVDEVTESENDDMDGTASNGGVCPPEGDSDPTDYIAMANRLSGTATSLVAWSKRTHLNSNGPASAAQYRYLVGVLNSIAGNKEAYRLLLGVMIGRHVDSSNPPGVDLASKLLNWLVAEHKDEVTGEKVANPHYRQDYVDCVRGIWQTVDIQ